MTYNIVKYTHIYKNIYNIKRYTIKLTKSEVAEFLTIINKSSLTSQTFRTSYILLNCDVGKYMDNFVTHTASAFFETFEPKEAKRLYPSIND